MNANAAKSGSGATIALIIVIVCVLLAKGTGSPSTSTSSRHQGLQNVQAAPTIAAIPASHVDRIYQLDPGQYRSSQDYNTWAPSACSATSMAEVINSYGHSYRIADILKVEAGLGQITPELGLLEPTGIDKTVDKFGFQTVHLSHPSIDDIIVIANQKHPVIVSFPPELWTGGHILVVVGGDSRTISLADSSSFNMTIVPWTKFLKYWGGFAVVVTPRQGGAA